MPTRRELLTTGATLPLVGLTGCSDSSGRTTSSGRTSTGWRVTDGQTEGDGTILLAEPHIGPIGRMYVPEGDRHNHEADAYGLYGRGGNESDVPQDVHITVTVRDRYGERLNETDIDVGSVDPGAVFEYEAPYDGDYEDIFRYVLRWRATRE